MNGKTQSKIYACVNPMGYILVHKQSTRCKPFDGIKFPMSEKKWLLKYK